MAQDEAARLIAEHFGARPSKDPRGRSAGGLALANYLKCPTDRVWKMRFIEFRDALKEAISGPNGAVHGQARIKRFRGGKGDIESAGQNRHGVADERAV